MGKKDGTSKEDAERVERFWADMDSLIADGLVPVSAVAARLAGIAARYQIEYGAKAAGQVVMERIAEALKPRG